MAADRIKAQIKRLLYEAEEAATLQDSQTVRARALHVLTFSPENHEGQTFLYVAQRCLEKAATSIDSTATVEHPALNVNEVQSSDILAGGVFVSRQQEMTDQDSDARSRRGRLVTLM